MKRFSKKTQNEQATKLIDIEEILKNLQEDKLEKVSLRNILIDESLTKRLIKILDENISLKIISFDSNQLNTKIFERLVKVLSKHPALEELYLQNQGLNDNEIGILAARLKFFPHLKTLNLSDNAIGNLGAQAIAEALKKNPRITEVSLYNNSLGDEAAVAFGNLLQVGHVLERLNLGKNKIGEQGAIYLAKGLKVNASLQKLFLGPNPIGQKGGQSFVEILQKNSTLLSFDCFECQFGSKYETEIQKLIERNITDRQSRYTGKGHSAIGDDYELLTEITAEERKALLEQAGILATGISKGNKIKVKLGAGEFGKVRLARLRRGQKEFIGVKKIKGVDKIAASKREIAIHKKLSGKKNIMPLYGYVEQGKDSQGKSALYLFMPLAGFGNGVTFKDCLSQVKTPLYRQKYLNHIAKSLLTGIMEMHRCQTYHLDIKPENFVINMQGEPFVIDFGCAYEVTTKQGQQQTLITQWRGDKHYFSPERCAFAQQQVTAQAVESEKEKINGFDGAKADAWAVGVTLFELITGHNPFANCKQFEDFQLQLAQISSQLNTSSAESLWTLIKDLLVLDPNNRIGIQQALDSELFKQEAYNFSAEECKEAFKFLKALYQPKELPTSHLNPDTNREEEIQPSAYSPMESVKQQMQPTNAYDLLPANVYPNSYEFFDTAPKTTQFFSPPPSSRELTSPAITIEHPASLTDLLNKLKAAGYGTQFTYEVNRSCLTFDLLDGKQEGSHSQAVLNLLQALKEQVLTAVGVRGLNILIQGRSGFAINWISSAHSQKAIEALTKFNIKIKTVNTSSEVIKLNYP